MERETGIEPATFSLARRCSTTEPLPLVRYVCETKIAYQGRFVNNLIVRQSEEPSHRDIFVNRFPMNPPALSNQFPLLALFISSVLQAWKPAKRGANLTWCQPLLSLIDKDRQKLFLSLSSRPAHWRSCQIPVCYDLRCCPREHSGWNVPPLDQQ